MAADTSVVKPLEAPPLSPLALKTKLAPTPGGPPKYPAKVKNGKGQEVILGDPRATRALLALMDVHAVNGGAACHWGGPAALAGIMAAIHRIKFLTQGRAWDETFKLVNHARHTENRIYDLRAKYPFHKMPISEPEPVPRNQ